MPRIAITVIVAWASIVHAPLTSARENRPSNVILIMTDDQGIGDFGFQGHDTLETPNLDRLAAESARLERFYVSPVCSPTRACLLTGRYNYRTRCLDTYLGRSMMESKEVTLAERLLANGYQTGIFGKWHLGDNYPLRPGDQGFREALVHLGGGIGQPSDPEGGEGRYTNPVLFHNGHREMTEGYCTDIYFDRAQEWIRSCHEKKEPFFAYIATNAPHGPFHDVPQELLEHYRQKDLSNKSTNDGSGHPLSDKVNLDRRARIYAMITNIDQNVGRLLSTLSSLGLDESTLVLFMIDNGPNGDRFRQGLKGIKGHVHEGGIRSPLWARLPGVLSAGVVSGPPGAHIDVAPTVLEACGVSSAEETPTMDGRSLWPLLRRETVNWEDRTLYIQAHRGDRPRPFHHFAAIGPRWKLLHPSGFHREFFEGDKKLELYDLLEDPKEQHDLASEHPEIVQTMSREYEAWLDDVSKTRANNFAPPRIHIDPAHENPVLLTRQNWRGVPERGWNPHRCGQWRLLIKRPGPYELTLRYGPIEEESTGHLRFGAHSNLLVLEKGSTQTNATIRFDEGPLNLSLEIPQVIEGNTQSRGALQIGLSFVGDEKASPSHDEGTETPKDSDRESSSTPDSRPVSMTGSR